MLTIKRLRYRDRRRIGINRHIGSISANRTGGEVITRQQSCHSHSGRVIIRHLQGIAVIGFAVNNGNRKRSRHHRENARQKTQHIVALQAVARGSNGIIAHRFARDTAEAIVDFVIIEKPQQGSSQFRIALAIEF